MNILSLYPKIFGYSLGAGRAPDKKAISRKNSTKREEERQKRRRN
jgi:hypothetical protein